MTTVAARTVLDDTPGETGDPIVRPLYLIGGDLAAILKAVEDADGEITPEVEDAMLALAGELRPKVEAAGLHVRNLVAAQAAIDDELVRLASRKAALGRRETWLREYIKTWMEAAGTLKVDTPLITVTVATNPPSVTWDGEPDTIPEGFRRISVTPDKRAVLAAWKAKQPIPAGFTVEQRTSLRVK